MGVTREEFASIVIKINQAYADKKPITKEGIDIWYELLNDLDARTLNAAANNYIMDNRYPPTIADLRQEYKHIKDHIAEINQQLREIYDRTRGTYPNVHLNDDEETKRKAAEEARDTWVSLIMKVPLEERVEYAKKIESAVINYVHSVEADPNRNKIPPLEAFFKGEK